MEKIAISSDKMHTSLAPISHGMQVGNLIFISVREWRRTMRDK